jgi:MOSC domain-containing protein YiiM
MKVVSTNIGSPRTVVWNKETITTGIFKFPIDEPIYLTTEGVQEDHVSDKKYHGGIDKACYLFSSDQYPRWQAIYPYLEWSYGMFGENITVEGFNEKEVRIGDVFEIGTTRVQVSEPRQPCFKLNVRFNSKDTVKQFVKFEHSGCYLRVIEEGRIEIGDPVKLIETNPESLTVFETYKLIYAKKKAPELIQRALDDIHLAESTKEKFRS